MCYILNNDIILQTILEAFCKFYSALRKGEGLKSRMFYNVLQNATRRQTWRVTDTWPKPSSANWRRDEVYVWHLCCVKIGHRSLHCLCLCLTIWVVFLIGHTCMSSVFWLVFCSYIVCLSTLFLVRHMMNLFFKNVLC